MSQPILYLWSTHKELLIEEQTFFVDQALGKLAKAFDDIQQEADNHGNEYLDRASQNFNPETDDPESYLERAYEYTMNFGVSLEELKRVMHLAVVASMYHKWEQELKKWMTNEIRNWGVNEDVIKRVSKATPDELIQLISSLGWNVKAENFYPKLDLCRMVCNVFKHGEGGSFNELKKLPEYFGRTGQDELLKEHLDPEWLEVSNSQILDFLDAICDFWRNIPEYIFDSDENEPAKWFAKLLEDNKFIINPSQTFTESEITIASIKGNQKLEMMLANLKHRYFSPNNPSAPNLDWYKGAAAILSPWSASLYREILHEIDKLKY
ncbi:hypothetical protein NBRC116188_19730 [Oceaniserpentilla sp. 4NH20-0058]|uniref:hypothetical protein n=1 Tax=Oceaniserpentilla sp. 4NH20-0058 TaxID=3127660 RepID=UPI00310358CB